MLPSVRPYPGLHRIVSPKRTVVVSIGDILALIWHAADQGRELPDDVLDQLAQWAGHATDAEIDAAVDEAREHTGPNTHARGALRRWRRGYCPGVDGSPRDEGAHLKRGRQPPRR